MAKPPKKNTEEALDDLLQKILEDAAKEDTPLSQRVDVFKVCSNHYAMVQKIKGKLPPGDDSPGHTMAGFQQRIKNGGSDDESS